MATRPTPEWINAALDTIARDYPTSAEVLRDELAELRRERDRARASLKASDEAARASEYNVLRNG